MKTILAIWKPRGPTSHDIVDEVRKITGERRVGHAGTLDPLAEGVLVVGVGREATRKLAEIVAKEKEYVATARLGMTSTTDDEEGIKERVAVARKPTRSNVGAVLKQFTGVIQQAPPVYSAVKVKGKAAYARARRGERLSLKPRTAEIKRIAVIAYRWPILKLRVVTGPGVYIRALARDIGAALGTGGYLASLTRTRVGRFSRSNSVTLDTLHSMRMQIGY